MALITNYRAADLLCSAFEGGSNYWYMIERNEGEAGKPWGDEYTPSYIGHAFSKDGGVVITDQEDEESPEYVLNYDAVKRGKELMETENYRHHLADVLKENDDANTGDVFLQLCLFGEVVYG